MIEQPEKFERCGNICRPGITIELVANEALMASDQGPHREGITGLGALRMVNTWDFNGLACGDGNLGLGLARLAVQCYCGPTASDSFLLFFLQLVQLGCSWGEVNFKPKKRVPPD